MKPNLRTFKIKHLNGAECSENMSAIIFRHFNHKLKHRKTDIPLRTCKATTRCLQRHIWLAHKTISSLFEYFQSARIVCYTNRKLFRSNIGVADDKRHIIHKGNFTYNSYKGLPCLFYIINFVLCKVLGRKTGRVSNGVRGIPKSEFSIFPYFSHAQQR